MCSSDLGRRAIIVKDPVTLEQIDRCRTAIFDKTGTLTYGEPTLTEEFVASEFSKPDVLRLAASVEFYSKHPLARAILAAAREQKLQLEEASRISEPPRQGLRAIVAGRQVQITNREKFLKQNHAAASQLPSVGSGLECIILIDGFTPRRSASATPRVLKACRLSSTSGQSIISSA